MKKLDRNIIIVTLHAIFIILIFLFLSRINNDSYLPEQQIINDNCSFNLKLSYNGKSNFKDINSFPTKSFLDSGNYKNVECLINTLNSLDTLTNDESLSIQILYSVLSDSLLKRDSSIFAHYNLDNLIRQMQWVEKLQCYDELDSKHRAFFNGIYEFWMENISNKLQSYSKDTTSIRHAFKYKFLVAKCNERKYIVGVKETSSEKVIGNLVRSDWGHLFDASWNQSTLLMKVIFIFFIFVFFYGIYCIKHKHFNK